MTLGEFIQQNPGVVVTIVGAIVGLLGTIGFVWRSSTTTKNKIRLQESQMAALKIQMAADQAKNEIARDALEARQKIELAEESERRYNRMQREVKSLYEKRLDDYNGQIKALEAKDLINDKKIEELLARIEKLAGELSEQKMLLQAEKRAYAELESFNDALQQNNEKLVKREQELMAKDAEQEQMINEMKRRIDTLAQRISDLEQDNKHKDAQIVQLQDEVLNFKKVTATGEMAKVVAEPEVN